MLYKASEEEKLEGGKNIIHEEWVGFNLTLGGRRREGKRQDLYPHAERMLLLVLLRIGNRGIRERKNEEANPKEEEASGGASRFFFFPVKRKLTKINFKF